MRIQTYMDYLAGALVLLNSVFMMLDGQQPAPRQVDAFRSVRLSALDSFGAFVF